MNLSKAARAVAIPSLEIDQPDCRRAAHSSSVGPIDATQLFYLESRGIPPDEARKFIVLGFLEPVVARVPLEDARDGCASCSRRSGRPASEPRPPSRPRPATPTPRVTRRVDLLGVDEVAEGTMKMAWVDGTDQVIVVHTGGEIRAFQGICTHEYFELDKGFLTGRLSPAGTLTCALHLSRFDLADGEPLDPPAELPLAVYPVGRRRAGPDRDRRWPPPDQRAVTRSTSRRSASCCADSLSRRPDDTSRSTRPGRDALHHRCRRRRRDDMRAAYCRAGRPTRPRRGRVLGGTT